MSEGASLGTKQRIPARRVWDLEAGKSMVLQSHANSVKSVSVTADGRRAVSGSWDKTLRVWNLETGESRVVQGHTDLDWPRD
jgi:WD40 repeat protein